MALPLYAELKRRRVFRALVGYGIAAFAVLQIIEPVVHGMHWPDALVERALALNPGDAENHRRYAVAILGPSGRLREAVREAQKATDLDPLSAIALASEIATRWSHAGAFQIAETYAWFGDRDVALGWLERAYAQHDSGLPYLNSDALLRSLHGDPRFAALVKKMKLPGG